MIKISVKPKQSCKLISKYRGLNICWRLFTFLDVSWKNVKNFFYLHDVKYVFSNNARISSVGLRDVIYYFYSAWSVTICWLGVWRHAEGEAAVYIKRVCYSVCNAVKVTVMTVEWSRFDAAPWWVSPSIRCRIKSICRCWVTSSIYVMCRHGANHKTGSALRIATPPSRTEPRPYIGKMQKTW